MSQPTLLNCSRTTATVTFILIGSLFCLVGCAQFYKAIGLSDEQIAAQVAADQTDRQEIIEGIRLTTTEILTTAVAGIGAIASGFLARTLGTEKKINKVLITAIEPDSNSSLKTRIKAKATAAGIEKKLNARVKALT